MKTSWGRSWTGGPGRAAGNALPEASKLGAFPDFKGSLLAHFAEDPTPRIEGIHRQVHVDAGGDGASAPT